MFSFFKRMKAAKLWVTALDKASYKKYEDAYADILKVHDLGLKGIESTLLNIFLCVSTDRFEQAKHNLVDIFTRIDISEKYNSHDKKYLLSYACWCNESLPEEYRVSISENYYISPSMITLSDVSSSLKSNFPLRIHPDWKLN